VVEATGLAPTVITFDPHPRVAFGNRVDLLTTLERRLELLADVGMETTLVAAFVPELQRLTPEEFADEYLRALGAEVVVAGEDFRFGVRRSGDLSTLERLGLEVVVAPEVDGVSSTAIRATLVDGDVGSAARMLGRPFELDGTVVAGDQRGGTLGYPTANLSIDPQLACPSYGIYAGAALGHRAAVSIGTNPHYGGTERRIEPYLLDFDGDLYGKRILLELWERLRDEAVFDSEQELVAPRREIVPLAFGSWPRGTDSRSSMRGGWSSGSASSLPSTGSTSTFSGGRRSGFSGRTAPGRPRRCA
jgi:riboflavin kinase/FMN adenylyltransferase